MLRQADCGLSNKSVGSDKEDPAPIAAQTLSLQVGRNEGMAAPVTASLNADEGSLEMSGNPRSRRAMVAAAALVGLAALAPGCGGARDSEGEVDRISEEITAVEKLLRDSSGEDRTEACVSYAVVCERAASVCLPAQRASTRDRCRRITDRCERNLTQYCGGVSPRIDAGWTADASIHDAYLHGDTSSDSRYWQPDTWTDDSNWRADSSSDSRYWRADAWTGDSTWHGDSSPDSRGWLPDASTDALGE